MAKTDFKPVMIRNVEFKWPRLNETYRYNSAEKRSDPSAPTAAGAAYSIAWEMTADETKKLHNELKAHHESCDTKGEFKTIFGMKKLESGNYEFRAKKNGVNSQGALNERPRVIDGAKLPLEDLSFRSGAKGSIRVTAYPTANPQTDPPQHGISLLIDTVQVTHAIYGGGGLDEFEEVATTMQGGIDEALDEFGPATAPATQAEPEPTLEDDEIPF